MSDLVHVKGLADLQKFMDQFPAKFEKNVMRGALRAGAKVIAEEAKRLVSSHSGALRDSIRVQAHKIKGGKIVVSIVAGSRATAKVVSKSGTRPSGIRVRYLNPYYASWVEFGTAAHWIKASDRPMRTTRRGQRMISVGTLNRMAKKGSLVIGGQYVGDQVIHPGAKPHPFMRPALDSQAQKAVVAAGEYIKKRLTKQGLNTADIDIDTQD